MFEQTSPLANLIDVETYDEDTRAFICSSGSLAYCWITEPLSFINNDVEEQFRSLLRIDFPENTILSVHLIADDYLEFFYKDFEAKRSNTDSFVAQASDQVRLKFLKAMQKGSDLESAPCVLRNYIVVFSLKLPGRGEVNTSVLSHGKTFSEKVGQMIKEIFGSCIKLEQQDWLFLMRNILYSKQYTLDGFDKPRLSEYDPHQTLATQVTSPSYQLVKKRNCIESDRDHIVSFVPLRYPEHLGMDDAVRFIGDLIRGETPLIYRYFITINMLYPDQQKVRSYMDKKHAYTFSSASKLGAFIPNIRHQSESQRTLLDYLDKGDKVVRAMWALHAWVPVSDEEREVASRQYIVSAADGFASRVISYFQTLGISLDVENQMKLPSFLNSLPLCAEVSAVRNLERYRTFATSQVVTLLPVFSEWKGAINDCSVPMISRTGQIMGINLFASNSNYNCCISASSGSGKSFLVNEMVANLLSTGASCWIIDIGRSYKKLCQVYGGEFIEFGDRLNVSLNPFSLVQNYAEDADMLFTILVAMISPSGQISEYQANSLKQTIKQLWDQKGQNSTIDDLEWLLSESSDSRVSDLAVQIYPYTAKGAYGHFFNQLNPTVIDRLKVAESKSSLVVLELEELTGRKDLQQLVLLQLIFSVNQKITQGDRSVQKALFIDECWHLLDSDVIAKFIETGYRRFRKYNGSVITITQALSDLYSSKSGQAIAANSANLFFLRQKPEVVHQLVSSNQLVLDDYSMNLITSLQTRKGEFSEIFLRTDYGSGVARLIIPRALQLLYSTNPNEQAALEQIMMQQGVGVLDAINQFMQQESQQKELRGRA